MRTTSCVGHITAPPSQVIFLSRHAPSWFTLYVVLNKARCYRKAINQERIQVLPRSANPLPTWSWMSSNTPGTLYRSVSDRFILSSITCKWVNTWEQKARDPDVWNLDPFYPLKQIWVLRKPHFSCRNKSIHMNLIGYFPLGNGFYLQENSARLSLLWTIRWTAHMLHHKSPLSRLQNDKKCPFIKNVFDRIIC